MGWNPPIQDGGSKITTYLIHWKKSADAWDDPASVHEILMPTNGIIGTHTISGLETGEMYSIRMSATNQAGEGESTPERFGWTQDRTPVVIDALVRDDELTMMYSRNLMEGNVPAAAADLFTAIVNGEDIPIETVAISGQSVVLTLEQAVTSADQAVVRYLSPASPDPWALRDSKGNYAHSFLRYRDVRNLTDPTGLPPLTAEFHNMPTTHDGRTPFSFRIAFSDSVQYLHGNPRRDLLRVTGGRVTRAWFLERNTRLWEITMQPTWEEDITIVLPGGGQCPHFASPCATGGRAVRSEVRATLEGREPTENTQVPEPLPENQPATGLPAIRGVTEVGEDVSVYILGIDDPDGLNNAIFHVQWVRVVDGTDVLIPGGARMVYRIQQKDLNRELKVRVTFTDDAGNEEILDSRPAMILPRPMTAEILDPPSHHDGSNGLRMRISFSYDIQTSTDNFRNHSLSVTGGTVASVSRVEERKDLLEVEIQPGTQGDLLVELPLLESCSLDGAICNEDGILLSSIIALKIPGPESVLTAAFQNAPESHNGRLPIRLRLAFSHDVTAGYLELRDNIIRVQGGNLLETVRADGRSDLWDLRVRPAGDGNIRLTIEPDLPCGQPEAVCTGGDIRLSNQPEANIKGPNRPPTGHPVILGAPRVGETLSVDISSIRDPDGLENALFTHQWVRVSGDDATPIVDATGSTYVLQQADGGKQIRVVTEFTDQNGNPGRLQSAALYVSFRPVTASFTELPASHDGSAAFTVRIAFSEDVDITAQIITQHALQVTGGSATAAQMVDQRADLWQVTVEPSGDDDVTVVLPSTTDCDDQGAVCTEHGQMLSNMSSATIAGPEPPEPPPSDPEPPEPPPAPTNLTGAINSDGSITLSWEAPDDASITGYQILRRRPTLGENTLLVYVDNTDSTGTAYTDTDVTAGTRHVYRVKAINAAGLSGWSNYVNVNP